MDKPTLDLSQNSQTDFYALVGRVSLLLVENNVDAITAAMFLREIVEAGGSDLTPREAIQVARNYVQIEG